MTVEVALVITIISVSVSVYFAIHNSKRSDNAEIERKATETATINVKLDDIGQDVKDIKYDISSVKKEVSDLREKNVMNEQSLKSLHKRVDTIEKRINVSSRDEE